jgi:hypothetical protein
LPPPFASHRKLEKENGASYKKGLFSHGIYGQSKMGFQLVLKGKIEDRLIGN